MRVTSLAVLLMSLFFGMVSQASIEDQGQAFSYQAPPCKGAKSPKALGLYLQTHDFRPGVSESPYTMLSGKANRLLFPTNWSRDTLLEVHADDRNSLETLRSRISAGAWNGDAAFSSRTDDAYPRLNQVQWFDLDDDGECDLLGWSFTDDGWGSKGRFQATSYFVFLQKDGHLKLADWSENPCGTEVAYTCGGQRPDAIVPMWRKGERLPYLVARSELFVFISGAYFSVLGDDKVPKERSVLRWNPKQKIWERPVKAVSDEINHFASLTPPPEKSFCIELKPDDFGADCTLPR